MVSNNVDCTMWIVQLFVRNSYAKRNLLLLRSRSRETRRTSGALGLMKSAIRGGAFIPSVQIER
jgi:hypothetical protein